MSVKVIFMCPAGGAAVQGLMLLYFVSEPAAPSAGKTAAVQYIFSMQSEHLLHIALSFPTTVLFYVIILVFINILL